MMTRKPQTLLPFPIVEDDRSGSGELLSQIRLGVSKSQVLAERLAGDPLVGMEARTLLARLQVVTAELDFLEVAKPRLRSVEDGPIWGKYRDLRH